MQRDLEAKKRRAEAPAAAAGDDWPDGEEPSSSSRRARADHWLHEGVVVKVMSKALKEHGYYKQKVGPWQS
jgi:DNA/RNA-binding protein KIN17